MIEEKWSDVRLINESQYRFITLNEEMHYPTNLDDVIDLLWEKIKAIIPSVSPNENKFLNINLETDFFKDITIILSPFKAEQNSNIELQDYTGRYFPSNDFIEGKLINPTIQLFYPYNAFDKFIKTSLSHELTHLYDDWNSRKNNSTISYSSNLQSALYILEAIDKDIYEAIRGIVYLFLKTERNAFITQAVNELEAIGCNSLNYKEKMKETFLYKTANTMLSNIRTVIGNISEDELSLINMSANQAKDKSFPRMRTDMFNAEEYKNKLISFAEKLHHLYLKRYFSVVYFYLTKWKGGHMVPINYIRTIKEGHFYIKG